MTAVAAHAERPQWHEASLGDVASVMQDGPFGSNLKSAHYVERGVRVVRLQNIGTGRFLESDKAFITHDHFRQLSKHRCLPGDVLIATLGDPIVRACRQPDSVPEALNKADCIQMRCDIEVADPAYVTRWLNSAQFQSQAKALAHGQTRPRVNLSQLRSARIPLPPIEEQRRIAAVLDQADELRAKRRAALALLDTLTESIFLDMFGDPVANPHGWPVVPFLDALVDRSAGQPKTPAGDFLRRGRLPLVDQGAELIGGYSDDAASQCTLPLPVIVFGDHTRAFKYVDFPFGVGADGVKLLVPQPGFDPRYLYALVRALRVPSAGYSRHFKYLKELTVPQPPVDLQRRFAVLVDAIDSRRPAATEALRGHDSLFASLQHRAFRGEL